MKTISLLKNYFFKRKMVSKKILASGAFGHRHESVLPTQAIKKK